MVKRKTGANDVETFISDLDHPMTPEILLLRKVILEASPDVTESIKWNAPSFATSEHFATFHLRARNAVQIVLHRGAKARTGPKLRSAIADPDALLEWRGDDRAIVTFRDMKEIEAKREPFAKIIRDWVKFV